MEQTRFMGNKILNFFKHLSVIKRVLLGIITLLVIGYIFLSSRQLFHVSYSTVVTDRNGELLEHVSLPTVNGDSSTKDDTRENQAMPHYFRRQEFLLSLGGSRPVIHRRATYQNLKQTYRQRRQYPHNADDPPGPP